MVRQKAHYRKVNNKYVKAGRGVKDKMIGEAVWYKKEVYFVKSCNKDGTYNIANATAQEIITNVKKHMLRRYI